MIGVFVNLVQTIWGAMVAFWNAALNVVVDPTGSLAANILVWLLVFGGGWFVCMVLLATTEIKKLNNTWEFRCSKQANLYRDTCLINHGRDCWKNMPAEIPQSQKVQTVHESMGFALLWVLPVAVLVLALPIVVALSPVAVILAVLWFAVLSPMFRCSKAIGNSMVNGTITVAERSTEMIIKRADQINQHKALEAKKK